MVTELALGVLCGLLADNDTPYAAASSFADARILFLSEAKTSAGADRFVGRTTAFALKHRARPSLDVLVFLRSSGVTNHFDEYRYLGRRLAHEMLTDSNIVTTVCETYLTVRHLYEEDLSELQAQLTVEFWSRMALDTSVDREKWYTSFYVQGRPDEDVTIAKPEADLINILCFWEVLGRPVSRPPLNRQGVQAWHRSLMTWWIKNKNSLIFDPKLRRIRIGSQDELSLQKRRFEQRLRQYEEWNARRDKSAPNLFGPGRFPPNAIPGTNITISLIRTDSIPRRFVDEP